MASFTYKREIAAPPETVFEVLTDHRGYAKITNLRKATLEREGKPVSDGVGAIRVLTAVGPPMREEVLAYEPAKRFSYKLLSGLPVRDHVGTVELTPNGAGTSVVYAVRTTPTLPLLGGAVIPFMKIGIGQLLGGVAKESERRAAAS
jgi:uncharacterized protein YndB with AHSA1/START domain